MSEIEKLRQCLNPREWTREMSEAWHKNIPDTQKAFEALVESAILSLCAEDKTSYESIPALAEIVTEIHEQCRAKDRRNDPAFFLIWAGIIRSVANGEEYTRSFYDKFRAEFISELSNFIDEEDLPKRR